MSRIAKFIDHTILKPEATLEQVLKLCEEAKYNQFASVCVNPCRVKTVSECLQGSGVKTCVVIGFPLGANEPETKAFETTLSIEQGAEEVDMVINVGKLKDGNLEAVERDIKSVCDAAAGKALVKVIIETCLLTDEEKVIACQLAVQSGAQFVKTSTGFSSAGANVADIMLMRQTVGLDIGVKASGGVRTYDAAISMLDAGASRIGTSSGVKMLDEEIHI